MLERDEKTTDAFDLLGLSPDDVDAFVEEQRVKKPNNQVCSCGHAMNKHHMSQNGMWSCNTARMWCPCQSPIVVAEASDTKFFMTKTYGYGSKHALATGLRRSQQKGVKTKLVIEPKCFRCGTSQAQLLPAGLSRHNAIMDSPSPRNGIFCLRCIYFFQGIEVLTDSSE